jgi:methionine synthase I (cobalamin-dependent)
MPRRTKQERAAAEALANYRRELVDEFGALDAELSPLRGKQRRHEELAKLIRSWHSNAAPLATLTCSGAWFEVILGQAGNKTRITDMSSVYQAMGHDKFIEHASVTLKALEESGLDSALIATLTTKERTGTRELIVRSIA